MKKPKHDYSSKSCTARLTILPCQRELVCTIVESETLRNKGSNSQIEVQIGEEEQSPDNHVNNPEKSDDNIVMFLKQLDKFREIVREGFDNLKSKFTVITLKWQKT